MILLKKVVFKQLLILQDWKIFSLKAYFSVSILIGNLPKTPYTYRNVPDAIGLGNSYANFKMLKGKYIF